MEDNKYHTIFQHYDKCFEAYGDSAKGVDWPNQEDAQKRYDTMLGVVKNLTENPSILDIGCGAGHFYEYLKALSLEQKVHYEGLDISSSFVRHCQSKFPSLTWHCVDLLTESFDQKFDYVVMNGVFTEKLDLSFEEMLAFWKRLLLKAFEICNQGLVFNVMSTQVDWQRDDLFHLPLDTMADFLHKNVSKHFVVRRDYGLYEYSVYIYKQSTL